VKSDEKRRAQYEGVTKEGDIMKILHILNDGPSKLSDEIIDVQSKEHSITIIDLSKKDISYGEIVDHIFSHDKVISW
jgi:hypothetical protein